MKLKTSRNKEYNVTYAEGPTRLSGSLMIRLPETRDLLKVGAEFIGLEHIEREDGKVWEGFTQLAGLRWVNDAEILVELVQGVR